MLTRTAVVIAAALLSWSPAFAQTSDEALVLRGVITSSVLADGRAAVVTLDKHGPSDTPDGLADAGFLLQFDPALPGLRIPAGYGEITVKSASLGVAGQDGGAVAFVVAGREARPVPAASVIPVVGLATYLELGGVTHAEFVSELSKACGAGAARAPDCEPCTAGGTGATQCEIGCYAGDCGVTCGGNYYACCKCSDIFPRCTCCREEGD